MKKSFPDGESESKKKKNLGVIQFVLLVETQLVREWDSVSDVARVSLQE